MEKMLFYQSCWEQIVFMKLIKKSCFRKNKKVVDKRQKI